MLAFYARNPDFDAVKQLFTSGPSQSEAVDRFSRWCRDEVFTEEMARAASLMEHVCDLHCEEIYRRLEMGDALRRPTSAAELASALGYVETAAITLEAMLWRLGTRVGLVAIDAEEPIQFQAARKARAVSEDLRRAKDELAALGRDYLAGFEFLDFGTRHFVAALRDDPELMDRMLSGREPGLTEVWDRATNKDPLQDVHGRLGARVLADYFSGGSVLEIGGGTGNGIKHLFAELASRGDLGKISRYAFTDVGMRFILETRRAVRERFPSVMVDYQFVDINRPLLEQKLEAESFDLVYGVNAAHVAKDIVCFLQDCRRVLRPGGAVVFSERVRMHPRQMAPREFTLNLSIYHRSATLRNIEYRPAHCYLTAENWLQILDRAGFELRLILPDLDWLADSFADPYAAVVVAIRR